MSSPDPEIQRIIVYARALARALRAFDVLETQAGWFERPVLRLLRITYRQRLRAILPALPDDVAEAILTGVDTPPQHRVE